jgi:hypothetical protein
MFMFNFMSSSFVSYKPLVLVERYMYPLFLPSLVLVGGLLATLLATETEKGLRRERSFWALITTIGIVGMSLATGHWMFTSRPEQIERRVTARLDKRDIVYTGYRTAANLVFFRAGTMSRFDETTMTWENVKPEQIPNGTYVLFNKPKVSFLADAYKYAAPSFASHPPRSWKAVWTYEDAELYLVSGN